MSWQETLGIAQPVNDTHAHNPHNTQKSTASGNSADIANCASANSDETDSKLLEVLSDACRDLSITPTVVWEALAAEDIEDWQNGKITSDFLTAFARTLLRRRKMDGGKRPIEYVETATCLHCGPIWLWYSGEVLGCPWCWNRVADRPIPRPCSVHCGDCRHFERTAHPHLGHCTKGEPEAAAGLWDTDRRHCKRYLP